ncbi:hypothetical protein LOAG_17893 [Loa loa]|uniref:Uncharacterized protein n=1 Tax=Loa loa TaxID=7209 RepID=A0A1S0UGN0_LOALO|nr:hypothetical protein LOAG_17893 [Loa loa]EJD74860.1 hypothetical protein LOAG_17893 [Loa loa]
MGKSELDTKKKMNAENIVKCNRAINDETDATSSAESEDDPEFRELEERSQIVEKYEKGPEQEVEEWENPDFELYKITDRYGFMHKNMQEISVRELVEKKRMTKEVSREQKWLRMMSRWSDGKGANDKLKKRLWKGVPEKFRSLAQISLTLSLICALNCSHQFAGVDKVT